MKLICMLMRVPYIRGFSVANSKILDENVMAVAGMKIGRGRGKWIVARGFVVRICEPGSRIEVAPFLDALSARHQSKTSGVTGLELGWTRVTGRPAFWRASMNGVNASPVVSPIPKYVSDCSSGSSSKDTSPSSDCRL